MSNSPLVVYTKLSPNKNSPRNKPISKITIHHTAGVLGVETIGSIFLPAARQASANYAIGSDGRVGMYVEEKDRSWASSSAANDHQAVTIEVSNSLTGGGWPVSDKVFVVLINLCADICKRNNIPRLAFDGTPGGSLTHHQIFAATNCPGPYLLDRFLLICEEVNKKLAPSAPTRAEYQRIIQSYCQFSDPAGVWAVLDTHKYADAMYQKWAESYGGKG